MVIERFVSAGGVSSEFVWMMIPRILGSVLMIIVNGPDDGSTLNIYKESFQYIKLPKGKVPQVTHSSTGADRIRRLT